MPDSIVNHQNHHQQKQQQEDVQANGTKSPLSSQTSEKETENVILASSQEGPFDASVPSTKHGIGAHGDYIARIPYTKCPVCGGDHFTHYFNAQCDWHESYHPRMAPTMEWVQCSSCGHIFTDGYYDKTALNELFFSSSTDGQNTDRMEINLLSTHRMLAAHIVRRVSSFRGNKSDGMWLDIGCGHGILMAVAKEFGYHAGGIDTREEVLAPLHKMGYRVQRANFEDLTTVDPPPDVLSLADVLEHMPHPIAALQQAHALLAPGGLLFLSMPNSETIVWRTLMARSKNVYLGEVEHFHNFSRTGLYRLLRSVGFEPVDYAVSERFASCMEVIAKRVEIKNK